MYRAPERETRRVEQDTCGCDGWLPVLAFVPVQDLNEVFEPECGFSKGTIFPELEKPFMTGRCAR